MKLFKKIFSKKQQKFYPVYISGMTIFYDNNKYRRFYVTTENINEWGNTLKYMAYFRFYKWFFCRDSRYYFFQTEGGGIIIDRNNVKEVCFWKKKETRRRRNDG